MQTALNYRTNRDLFSNHYLDKHLPETEEWDEVSDDELQEAYDDIMDLWEREKDTAPKRNESQLEEKFIRPMFRKLGIPFEVEESTSRTQRRPDYGFFESDDAARDAFERREEGGDFYKNSVAVADAKRWGRPLDTRGSGEHERDFENPSYQIHVYLQETPARWAVLTDGKRWRLYYGPTSHRLDSYYEIDLPTVLEKGDLEDFKYFYLFFRHGAFLEDAGGDSFLDDVYDESNVFAQELGEDLQDNIYEAIKVLAEGFLQYPDNDLDEETLVEQDVLPDSYAEFEEARLDLIHDSSLIYLYRLIFVLYAEAEGRELLDTNNEIYEQRYSLNSLKQEVAEELDSADPTYRAWQDDLQSSLDGLFTLIDQGSKSRGIPEKDLYIPAYNGGLFRTDPDEDDSREAQFLADYQVGDAYLARVIELLTRSQNANAEGKIFVDYSSLDVRHLGSIYEGLLEYQLNVANDPLALDDGEYVEAEEGDEIVVHKDDVYLTTGSGERKATGSYYTPEYVVEYIVDETLGPVVDEIREDLVGYDSYSEGGFATEFADRIFELKILDPAMGSGHFLTSVVDYLAREIIDAQEKQAAQEGIETVDEHRDINWARRQVAQRCIYGVDLNPLAVELAKVSLWLRTLAAEQPLAFLDHHLKTGNSLVGSDIETVLDNGDSDTGTEKGQLTLQESFDRTRRQALEHVTDRFENLLAIDNETLDDIKEMEAVYEDVRDDPLYLHLIAMANVHTAEQFGLDIPADAYERMAEALRGDSWNEVEGLDWYRSAQTMAEDQRFFHWELEFPIAFYEQDGERKENSGFDAVIGNPPYGAEFSDSQETYLRDRYPNQDYQLDTYLLFIEQGLNLNRSRGRFGMIVPNTWLSNLQLQSIRKLLFTEKTIRKIRYYQKPVFENVTVDTLVLIAQNKTFNKDSKIKIELVDDKSEEYQIPQERWSDRGGEAVNIFERPEIIGLSDKIRNQPRLDKFCKVTQGTKPFQVGKGSPEQTQEIVNKKPYVSDEQKTEQFRPLLSGKHVNRYVINWDSNYWIKFGDWLAEPRYSANYDVSSKILIRQTADSLIATLDTDQFIVRDNLYTITCDCDFDHKYLLGLLNSKLLNWYYQQVVNPEKGEALAQVKRGHVSQLPICPRSSIDSEINISTFSSDSLFEENNIDLYQGICNGVQQLLEIKDQRQSLNLSLLDYLGNYKKGPSLPDAGLFQPTDSTILDATTTDYEKLRVGDVMTERSGNRVSIHATARYKPIDEDEYETDRWGYTETEQYEAFTLTNLTDEEATLIEAFVPVAVEKSDGFAGFRDNATKNISLTDRLKTITLPDPNDVTDDLRRYTEVKEQAEDLDEKIEKINYFLNEIVYQIYDLTDDEIEIIESAFQDD
ncbi:Eco57I restriction-modification methylase domain-containing protein [Natranaeroarchaeum aerophilus]|uniref:site-specific DNA-methyltransferase (adenine-specific) n=1 Tax=Natranaeroarchaeum aerophilus TaxID=2917711 RepID=A0AAE3K3G1_9EURY|nr:TaqI-like C-terminal specificity domain-containing protein [Natranaeroarchaeum aerophilus]MCL9812607.1 N-6 DNA methylase [Natranaeroarchaeum aerophilus]